jgi:hypothetical protein
MARAEREREECKEEKNLERRNGGDWEGWDDSALQSHWRTEMLHGCYFSIANLLAKLSVSIPYCAVKGTGSEC